MSTSSPDLNAEAPFDGSAENERTTMRNTIVEQMDGNTEAAEVAIAAADELAAAMQELEVHREKVKELEDQLLRRAAEFQNYRRRTSEDLANAVERGHAEMAVAMVDILDDLRRSRDAADEAAKKEQGGALYQALKDGVDLIYQNFETALAGFNVKAIDSIGQPFNEAFHEALMRAPSEQPSGTVVGEIRKGYLIGDRVLRHAQVVVSQ